MKTIRLTALTLFGVLALCPEASAEIRSLSLGIGLNCPFGLGECYPQVYAGLVSLPGAELVAEEADGEHGTCVVRPLAGRMLDPQRVGEFIEQIRIGARLRGMEATVDGRLEERDGQIVLYVSDAEVFHLAPLEKKVQWDFRTKSSFPAAPVEISAYTRLIAQWDGRPRSVRLIGPVVKAAKAEGGTKGLILQVREFYSFGQNFPAVDHARLGIRVNSPYGLTEPWSTLKQALAQFPGVDRVPEVPELETSTVDVRLHGATNIQPSLWASRIKRAGAGAEFFGVEVSVEGRLVKRRGQLALQPTGTETWIPLAPVTRNVKWDYRKRREILPTEVEQNAYYSLLQKWAPSLPPVRVVGPLVVRNGKLDCLLEVREFGMNAGSVASEGRRDFSAPEAPKAMRAKSAPGKVRLIWARSRAADLAGYHVYRSEKLTGPYTRVNPEMLSDRKFEAIGGPESSDVWYSVTAVDRSGNESPRSNAASAAPPAAPKSVKLALRDGAAVLDWDDNTESDFDSYTIYRSSQKGGPYGEIASVIYESTYTNFGLQKGKVYYFVVTGVDNSFNESAPSEELSVKVPDAPKLGQSGD